MTFSRMTLSRIASVAFALIALPVCAHEIDGRNGGRVTDAGKFHVELVAKDRTVDVYVLDGDQKPIPVVGFKGTAILVVGGRPIRITLSPADGARLVGTSEVLLTARLKGAVKLTAPDGSMTSGRFD